MVRKIRYLKVLMNGLLVGRLTQFMANDLQFTYDYAWLSMPGARPLSLSLPLREEPFNGDKVYSFFDNLLPDDPAIRARIQARFQLPTDQPFNLLASIGRDCIGAVQLCEEMPNDSQEIHREILNETQIADVLKNHRQAPLGMAKEADDFRISLAGAQEKAGFLFYKDQWCRPLGSTPTTHIFKLPIGILNHQSMDLSDSCENEWLCAQIAKAYDLPVADCFIQEFMDTKVLVTKRFDRKFSSDGQRLIRLPQEDLCQALGFSPHLKYQADGGPSIVDIMGLLLASSQSKDREYFFRAQVLFWLLAAIDGHAKNFSLFLQAFGRYHLTPLYDIISAYPLIEKKQLAEQKIKMAMALIGKKNHYHWYGVQHRHFINTAKAANFSIDRAKVIVDEMLEKLDEVVLSVADHLPKNFPNHIAEPIFSGMKKMRDRISLK